MEKEFSSSLLENAVNEFAHLPGIGRKTALRLVLHLLREDEQVAFRLGESLTSQKQNYARSVPIPREMQQQSV